MELCAFDGETWLRVAAALVEDNRPEAQESLLAAQDAGLGACWVTYFDPKKTAEVFELPKSIVPVAFLPLGYPADDAVPADSHT